MPSVEVEITRYVNASFPGWVEFVLDDARGVRWTFVDKVPVVSTEDLTEASDYPRSAKIECEVVSDPDVAEPGLVKIDTSRPWGIEAKDGTSKFVVRHSQMDRK
jgi:hypothetical protein